MPALRRIVLVTRKTPLEHLLERHGTLGQVKFFLQGQKREIKPLQRGHELRDAALKQVADALPPEQARVRVDRGDLDRFVFRDDDLILAVGQDGLVANVAKYLQGQVVIGVNPDPESFDGVLCPHRAEDVPALLAWPQAAPTRFWLQPRTMLQAVREDGQKLLALNEIYFGSRTHQSARYTLHIEGRTERQSSSGVIVCSGTGATGWGLSIARQRQLMNLLPGPTEPKLAWFVREPFPSVATGTELDHGLLQEGEELVAISEMGEGGGIFADGIETDFLEFAQGQGVRISIAAVPLQLMMPGEKGLAEFVVSHAAPATA